jgi:hypothetical protein
MSVFIKGKSGGVKGVTMKVARGKPVIPQELHLQLNDFIKKES